MKTKFIIITILIAIIFTSCNQTKKETSVVEKSATIFYNGDIITMESDEPTYAEAIVEENGIIVFVGNKDEALGNYNKANLVDLQGKTMLPAFLDGHGHFYNVGFTAMCANILPPPDGPGVDFNSVVETLNKYKETEKGKYVLEKLGWIIGNGYDDSQLAEKDHLQASDLDKVSTDVPVVIIHQSGHLASINTKGLELMGYTADTPDPDGGVIRKDSNGNPNGVLEEAAFFNIIFPVLGKIDDEMAAKCIKQGQDEYAKKGYLTAQDGRTTIDQLAALRKAADEQAYYIDVVAYPDMTLGT